VLDPEVNNASRHLFAVNPDTGEIVVASEFTGSGGVGEGEAREYQLTVRASDAGLPVRSVDAVLRVVVNGSLPHPHSRGGALRTGNSLVTGNHVTLVVVIAGGSALLTVALVVAIALLRTRGRKSRSRRLQQYDVQRSLTSDDLLKSTVTSFETVPLSSTYCGSDASLAPPPQSTSRRPVANGTTVHLADSNFTNSSSTVMLTNNCTLYEAVD